MATATATAINPLEGSLFIFTDLETESIKAKLLLQIAAVSIKGDIFNNFINPQQPLPEECSKLLGLFYLDGTLYRNGTRITSIHIVQALRNFMRWIEHLNEPVTLVFHNGFSFDCTILARFLTHFAIHIPSNLKYVADTLPAFREELKDSPLTNFKLSTVAAHFNITNEYEHDALSDSKTLLNICKEIVKQDVTRFPSIFHQTHRAFSEYVNRCLYGTEIKPIKKKKSRKKSKATKILPKKEVKQTANLNDEGVAS